MLSPHHIVRVALGMALAVGLALGSFSLLPRHDDDANRSPAPQVNPSPHATSGGRSVAWAGAAPTVPAPPMTAPTPSAPRQVDVARLGEEPLPPTPVAALAAVPAAVPVASPTPTPRSATEVFRQVADVELALQTVMIEAMLDYGNASRTLITMRYDRGHERQERHLHLTSTSQGSAGHRSMEILAIGERTWHRGSNGQWVPSSSQDGLWEQVQVYLPEFRTSPGATVSHVEGSIQVGYYDPQRNADSLLLVDAATGIPRQLQQRLRDAPVELHVTYIAWNTPVDIAPPPAP